MKSYACGCSSTSVNCVAVAVGIWFFFGLDFSADLKHRDTSHQYEHKARAGEREENNYIKCHLNMYAMMCALCCAVVHRLLQEDDYYEEGT